MAYETVNPATGECLRRFEEHSDADVTAALNAAHSAYCTWRQESFEGRARLVHRVADLMRERIEPLSALITFEMGKLPAESRGETALSADILSYYADNAQRFLAPREIPQKDGTATLVYDPVGIVFAIEPWNFPYYQLARVVGSNLMTGNTVITKHASGVPQCAAALERAKRLARSIDAGMVFINHGAWTAPELPFGGVKSPASGANLGSSASTSSSTRS